ncbi:hypothetical protein [Poritiphilus flavus]|uniref:hypothetical protein n=1 Tax=Poritiphilus flavus TaxID=2697053 RepID=UPI001EEC80E3|nr:hypothetical protein [Poritiphilus flavus]
MKKAGVFFFVFLYMLAMYRPVAPVFEYIVNQDYIAEFFCINQDKPELDCNGKCYLMQMLNEQNEEKQRNLPSILMEEYPIGFVVLLDVHAKANQFFKRSTPDFYLKNYHYLYSYQDFHPPTSVNIISGIS